MVKQLDKKNAPIKKDDDLTMNRLMTAFVGVFLLIYGMLFLGRFPDKQVYYSILPALCWVVLALFVCSVIYFAVLRIRKIDESKRLVRSYILIAVFAVLYGGFTLYRYMKISNSQLIFVFIFFTVLYFLCSIFADKVRIHSKK